MEEDNKTSVTHFILLGFGNDPKLQILFFLVFLIIYGVTMAANIIIIVLVIADCHLHTPMYFFLGNLSFVETCYTSTVLPRMLLSFLTGDRTISIGGCLGQFFCFGFLAITELYLLAAMSYDRYLAICKPLHYVTLMNTKLCFLMSAGSWLCGIVVMTLVISLLSQQSYCSPNEMDHFICELAQLMNASCCDVTLVKLVSFTVSIIDIIPSCLLTLLSYMSIIATILQIPSTTERKKAFSTCSSHLIVVSVFYGSLIVVYILPKQEALRDMDKIFSVFYTILTPLINPLIYSLRNKEVKEALKRAIHKHRISK